jgi:hypothetical protein
MVQGVGGNCYRAIIQGSGGVKNGCAPRECPLVLARRDRPARVEPQAMAARGRDVSTSSMHRYVLSYAIRHPAAGLLARARARRRKSLRTYCWLALLLYECWKPDMPACCERIECACARRRRTSRPLGGEPNGCLIVSVSRGSSWAPTSGVHLLALSLALPHERRHASAWSRDSQVPVRRSWAATEPSMPSDSIRPKASCVAPLVLAGWPGWLWPVRWDGMRYAVGVN